MVRVFIDTSTAYATIRLRLNQWSVETSMLYSPKQKFVFLLLPRRCIIQKDQVRWVWLRRVLRSKTEWGTAYRSLN